MSATGQIIVNSIITGSIYALASSGLALSYGLLRVLNFAHGQLMMLGAYAFFFASSRLGYSTTESCIFFLIFSVLLGQLSARIFINPFLDRNRALTFITTISLGLIIENAVALYFGANLKSFLNINNSAVIELGFANVTQNQIIIICVSLSCLLIMAYLVQLTAIGRAVRAVSENEQISSSLGINSKELFTWIFTIATVLAGLAGILIGLENNLQPTMGANYTLKAFAAIILGGFGNVWGAVVASFILGFIENFAVGLDLGQYSLPFSFRDTLAYVVIVLILLCWPRGLFGKVRRRV